MIMDALDYAGDQGARVVNASLGGLGDASLGQQLAAVVGQHPGTLYVVAAGNDGIDIEPEGTHYLPCETPAPNVLCVGATGSRDQRAIFERRREPAHRLQLRPDRGRPFRARAVGALDHDGRQLRVQARHLDGDPEHRRGGGAAALTQPDA